MKCGRSIKKIYMFMILCFLVFMDYHDLRCFCLCLFRPTGFKSMSHNFKTWMKCEHLELFALFVLYPSFC